MRVSCAGLGTNRAEPPVPLTPNGLRNGFFPSRLAVRSVLAVAACAAVAAVGLLLRSRRRLQLPAMLQLRSDPRHQRCSLPADAIKAQLPTNFTVAQLELHAPHDMLEAKQIYDDCGGVLVRGLTRAYADEIRAHAVSAFNQAVKLMQAGAVTEVHNDGCFVGN